ncbi:PE domain-containing protein [Actinokineospora diospyrosa]|uniref:PE family protein n=1 Tax=Actinokineospora diospyrosa TaxID=103728 RepID=A0ABT1IK33_9PSEU|nr:PE domain-containing protein [Actinokineospora diospyrosa]MCP2273017.1 PE family protein [Actinokineospora diospyrosa]
MTWVHNAREAEALRARHKPVQHLEAVPEVVAGPRGDFTVTGGGDVVEVDYAALEAADRELAGLHDDLIRQLRAAEDLGDPLAAGAGPVAAAMSRSFLGRADTTDGVRAVLANYIEELAEVRATIRASLVAYRSVDEHAESAIRHAGGAL